MEAFDDEDEEPLDGFYRMPSTAYAAAKSPVPQTGSSIGSFADFVSAPGRGRRFRPQGTTGFRGFGEASGKANPADQDVDFVEEVLFDSDELAHSKFGTEESTSVSSRDDETGGGRTPGGGAISRERSGYSNPGHP